MNNIQDNTQYNKYITHIYNMQHNTSYTHKIQNTQCSPNVLLNTVYII